LNNVSIGPASALAARGNARITLNKYRKPKVDIAIRMMMIMKCLNRPILNILFDKSIKPL
jgi:hypothetical protein